MLNKLTGMFGMLALAILLIMHLASALALPVVGDLSTVSTWPPLSSLATPQRE
jgi:hypothetical protein